MYLYQLKYPKHANAVIIDIKKILPVTDVEIEYVGRSDAGCGMTKLKVRWTTNSIDTMVYISELPGSCGILVAYFLPEKRYVDGSWIRTDIQAINVVEAIARFTKYASVMISHIADNPVLDMWMDHGYEEVHAVRNPHSGNNIVVLVREL